MTNMRKMINLIESAELVDLRAHKATKTKEKVGNLVGGFQAYLDSIEKFKQLFGRFEPMLQDYKSNPCIDSVPVFEIRVKFDRVATRQEKSRLKKAGFKVFNDDPDWGTMIYDHPDTTSWTHGSYAQLEKKPTSKNWYTQTSAVKQISLQDAETLWARHNNDEIKSVYGIYQPDDIHYNKENLHGDSVNGWDIRTHPDHAFHYHNGMSFCLYMAAPDHSQDCAIKDDKYFADAVRVYKAIRRAEEIRNSVAPDKVANLSDYK